ncbi:MAG: hypothetical protein GY913_25145 [Proteobacteria bacterium]|nr:hypothetical protein [Pseudomonadota bacterium]
MSLLLASVGFVATDAQASTWSPDATIEEAAQLHVMPEGLDAITDLIPALIPEKIDLGTVVDESGGTWCFNYEFSMYNLWVGIELVDATLTPQNGYLELDADLLVQVNDASDKFGLDTEIACISTDCPGYVEPFPVSIYTTIALEVVQDDAGNAALDATIGDIELTGTDITDYLQLDCWIGDLEEILNWVGLSLYDLIWGIVEGVLDDMIAGLAPDLEEAIEDAFSSATIEEELEVGEATLTLKLQPADVTIEPEGVTVLMSGSATADEANSCIAAYDPAGSPRTDSPLPTFADIRNGTHMSIELSDDFTNQLLYGAWRGGVLCYEISGDDPLPINTSLLGLIAGDTFDPIFGDDTKPMVIATRPKTAPVAYFDGAHDLDAIIDDLGLHFYGEVDDRMAQVVGLDLDIDAGANLNFDGTTGDLAIELALTSENVTADVIHNELMTGTDEAIEESFGGAFDTILETVLGGLLGDALAFGLPSFEGVGMTDLHAEAIGSDLDWLAVWANVGITPYEGSGCGGCGGEEGADSGCDSGCASGHFQTMAFWTILPLAICLMRRKEDEPQA